MPPPSFLALVFWVVCEKARIALLNTEPPSYCILIVDKMLFDGNWLIAKRSASLCLPFYYLFLCRNAAYCWNILVLACPVQSTSSCNLGCFIKYLPAFCPSLFLPTVATAVISSTMATILPWHRELVAHNSAGLISPFPYHGVEPRSKRKSSRY